MIKAVIFDMYETLITHYQSTLYFGGQMAADAGIPEEKFRRLWDATEQDRTIGKLTFEDVIEAILKENNCYSDTLFHEIVQKRTQVKEECFAHLHKDIVPLLEGLRKKGLKVGLISNCFSEETAVIRKSVLFPYFDAVCLSYEQGVMKPDAEIFRRCIGQLQVDADACLYVGDGGSHELEAAQAVGMKAVQAVWYLQEGTNQPCGRKEGFLQVEHPLELLQFYSQTNAERRIKMKFDSEKFRRDCAVNDQKRDAGLTTPENIKRYDDIAYGPYGRYNLLDIYHKKDVTAPQKTIIDIHGGGWTYGDKDLYQHYCMDMAQRGFTVVNFSYRLSPENPFPAALQDINTAFTWVAEHAGQYNIDLGKICVTGDSAGAQLASQYLALLSNSAYRDLFSMQIPYDRIVVKAVALNCGCYDMRRCIEEDKDEPFLSYVGRALSEDRRGTLERMDVIKYINADFPPAYVMTAWYDFLKDQAQPMYELLKEKGIVCEYGLYGAEGDEHMGHVFHLNQRLEEAKVCNDAECAFFDRMLGIL